MIFDESETGCNVIDFAEFWVGVELSTKYGLTAAATASLNGLIGGTTSLKEIGYSDRFCCISLMHKENKSNVYLQYFIPDFGCVSVVISSMLSLGSTS